VQVNNNKKPAFGTAFARVKLKDITPEIHNEALRMLSGNMGKTVRVCPDDASDRFIIAAEKDGKFALFCPQTGNIGVHLTGTETQENGFIAKLNSILGVGKSVTKIIPQNSSPLIENEKKDMLNWLIGK